jgi:hypothetical protein
MTLSLRIHNIETIKTELANARKDISKLGKIKKKHRNILHNIDNVLRRELDTSPYQTILTPGGLWIDYDPDLKKGKVKKYYDDLVKEPFSKLYTKPNKEAMQQAMNEDFKVMFGDSHVATIEYTKFKEEDLEKEKKPSIFGEGKNRWKPTLGMEEAPKGSIIRAYYYANERVDEKRFEDLSKNPNYDDDTRDYFKRIEVYYMNGLRYEFKGINLPQFRIFASAGDWFEALEEFGDEVFKMYPSLRKRKGGYQLNYIPLQEVKIYNRDDPDDVAYDGPIDELH